ncbi:MAG: hypothetical protein MZV70_33835 [Desulfobacterales bacterium]|nr:hypothetical protein [Desulfobacterales bacterium]
MAKMRADRRASTIPAGQRVTLAPKSHARHADGPRRPAGRRRRRSLVTLRFAESGEQSVTVDRAAGDRDGRARRARALSVRREQPQ